MVTLADIRNAIDGGLFAGDRVLKHLDPGHDDDRSFAYDYTLRPSQANFQVRHLRA